MNLLFFLGNSTELAKKEIEATATILPFSYSTKIVSSDVLMLKLDVTSEISESGFFGFQSRELTDFFAKIFSLQNRLGGTIKIGVCLKEFLVDDAYSKIEGEIEKTLESINVGGGKFCYGISKYGNWGRLSEKDNNINKLAGFGLSLKKKLTKRGLSIRYIYSEGGSGIMSSAQVYNNKLSLLAMDGSVRKKGAEFLFVLTDHILYFGVTLTVQNIESYSFRDFKIPKPDPVSGMLPPKLAQIMLNMTNSSIIYDPFCGNGRVLMEGLLMGRVCYGSDISPKKVASSKENLKWFKKKYKIGDYSDIEKSVENNIHIADATSENSVNFLKACVGDKISDVSIVTEPYLGKPLTRELDDKEVNEWLGELLFLYGGFLENWSNSGFANMIVVFPRAKIGGGEGRIDCSTKQIKSGRTVSVFENLIDKASFLRYDSTVLGCYGRPDSFVIREIVKIDLVK